MTNKPTARQRGTTQEASLCRGPARLPEHARIRVCEVTKVFRRRSSVVLALHGVSFTVVDGEFVCIVGPSGCGKTTLLRILAGLEKQTSGRVYMTVGTAGGRADEDAGAAVPDACPADSDPIGGAHPAHVGRGGGEAPANVDDLTHGWARAGADADASAQGDTGEGWDRAGEGAQQYLVRYRALMPGEAGPDDAPGPAVRARSAPLGTRPTPGTDALDVPVGRRVAKSPVGGDIRETRRGAGRPLASVVFQEQSLFPWMSVRENVEYGLRVRGVPPAERRRVAEYYIELAGLSGFAHAYPHQLSGGMKQRASVARAFANDPEILLMDEPFGSLDEQNRMLLQQELLRIWEQSRKTAVFITHSIDEAVAIGDRVLVMTARPGTIKASIDVTLPRPRRVAEIRSEPGFLPLFNTIRSLLSEEVLRAREAEAASRAAPRRG